MTNKPLSRAIKLAGGLAALGRELDISRQAVFAWKKCPPEHVLKVEKATGVPRYELRPDLYGPAP